MTWQWDLPHLCQWERVAPEQLSSPEIRTEYSTVERAYGLTKYFLAQRFGLVWLFDCLAPRTKGLARPMRFRVAK